MVKYLPSVQKIFPLGGVQGAQGRLTYIWDPSKISETYTRARMLKLKTQLDIVRYSLWVKKILR